MLACVDRADLTAPALVCSPLPPAACPAPRYPFLLVDRVLEWEYGKYAVGYKVRGMGGEGRAGGRVQGAEPTECVAAEGRRCPLRSHNLQLPELNRLCHPPSPCPVQCVTINDNFFPGHFPQRAIMPGGWLRCVPAAVLAPHRAARWRGPHRSAANLRRRAACRATPWP